MWTMEVQKGDIIWQKEYYYWIIYLQDVAIAY